MPVFVSLSQAPSLNHRCFAPIVSESSDSELVALKSTLELDHTEPVVVGRLGLVHPVSVKESCTAEIANCGFVEHKVDNLHFEATATTCHGL